MGKVVMTKPMQWGHPLPRNTPAIDQKQPPHTTPIALPMVGEGHRPHTARTKGPENEVRGRVNLKALVEKGLIEGLA
jgi:hypothetical protein